MKRSPHTKGKPAYLNPRLPVAQRVHDLVARMTLKEKVSQMIHDSVEIPRLGIHAYNWWSECLHGVSRAGRATVFPQAIGMAAAWDVPLLGRVAEAISDEARVKHHQAARQDHRGMYQGLTFWSPNINIFRDPRWGRGQETYGEDPFLTGRMAVAFIQGMQGNDPHYFKVIATAKHYAVHSGPESTRHSFDARPSERDLNGTYLSAFRASIEEGKADSVMCSYNRVDGAPSCASTDLLERRLRGEWGFQGYVVSDCGAISDIFRGHRYKPDAAEASAAAVKAGTDLTCGNEYRALVSAVQKGVITEAEVNRSLERLFVARFKLGMFDPPERVPFSKIPYSVTDSEEHRKMALEAARKSIVLLKNQNQTLPLAASIRRIAVIGPAANDEQSLLGNYNGFSKKHVAPLEGIQRQFAGKAEVRYALGATYAAQAPSLIPSSALTPPSGSGHGLLAEYFDNPEFQGQPKLARVEPRPTWEPSLTDIAFRGYSLRWTGKLQPPVTGEYAISTRGGSGRSPVRVFIDGRELAAANPRISLEAGKSYQLRAQYTLPGGPSETTVQVEWIPPAEPLLAEAIQIVKDADVTLAFLGLNPNMEGEQMPIKIPGFAGGDRTDLNLPATQERMLEAAVATGKPVVVVLSSGSALACNYAAEHAAAVLELWYGGEEAGTAIAETLAGANNPAGRLPVTFYHSVDQLPAFDDYSMDGRTYRYFKGDALYGFGFGLSYSKFVYSGLKAKRSGATASISVQVKNSSPRDGDEVVQLYVAGDSDGAIRDLRGFQRVHLGAGETRDIEFTIPVPKNKVRISVGGGQPVGPIPHVDATL
jgi:beta-glucosidase